jgi:LysR family transcriptional regulator (chromosome initiation inhibitor)
VAVNADSLATWFRDVLGEVATWEGVALPPVVHRVPTSGDFLEAVRRGLGWGLLPEHQLRPGLADGSLVRIGADVVDVPLHWMRWRLDSPLLDRLGTAVMTVAGRQLRPATSRR